MVEGAPLLSRHAQEGGTEAPEGVDGQGLGEDVRDHDLGSAVSELDDVERSPSP